MPYNPTWQQQHAARKRAILARYKTRKGCVECGYRKYAEALDFDHIADKGFGIGRCLHYSWDRIKQEIAKCEIVCANCHRHRTLMRKDYASGKATA